MAKKFSKNGAGATRSGPRTPDTTAKRASPGHSKLDDPELRERLIDAILETRSIKKACTQAGVSQAVWFYYIAKPENHDLKLVFDEVRKATVDVLFEECKAIADDDKDDMAEDDKGRLIPNSAAVQRARLRIDTRMRIAGKLKPKDYGDQPAVAINTQTNNILCDEETRAKIQEMRQRLLGNKGTIIDVQPDHTNAAKAVLQDAKQTGEEGETPGS